MKLTVFLVLIAVTGVFASESYSQTTRLSLKAEKISLEDFLVKIEEQSEFRFFYTGKIDVEKRVSGEFRNKRITEILDAIKDEVGIDYEVMGRQIILSPEKIQKIEKAGPQQNSVFGKITDEAGLPLPGVTVFIKGTTSGTVADNNGNYRMTGISPENTLVFSFVGMLTQEIKVGNQTQIDVNMKADVVGIEEVVAIGYGTLKRNRISTAISTVKTEALTAQVTRSVDQSIEGKVAGLVVKQNSGAPGAGAEIVIRGTNTFSYGGGSQPLFVIDGVPMHQGYGKDRSPFSLLDQEDIESLDVLKGAAATAIYGSRGANGVIIIKTKQGVEGKTSVSVASNVAMDVMLEREKLDLLTAREFAQWRKENLYDRAQYYGQQITDENIPAEYRNPEQYGEGTDWYDLLTRKALKQNYNINVTHGTKKFKGFFSMGYTNDNGIIKETGFERLAFRANMNYQPNEYIKVGLNLNPTRREWEGEAGGLRTSNYGTAFMSSPIDGPYIDENAVWEQDNPSFYDGIWDLNIQTAGTFTNPNALYNLKHQQKKYGVNSLSASPYIVITPVKGLNYRAQYNINTSESYNEQFSPSTVTNMYQAPPAEASGSYSTTRSEGWQFINTLTYDKQFGEHNLTAMAGYTREHYNSYYSTIIGSQYSTDLVTTIAGASQQSGTTEESNWSLISYMFRASYDYKSKYLFTGAIRRDGSSRFGPDNRWGYFPSVSAGWNITKEDFFPKTNWIETLKLRASYGVSGNNNIGDYTWIPRVYTTQKYSLGGNMVNGSMQWGIENTELGWEQKDELDLGLDFILFDGRISVVMDYYDQTTKDMLTSIKVPNSSGSQTVKSNKGEITNRGFEFGLKSININKKDFKWGTDFNIAFNKNEVVDLGGVAYLSPDPAARTVEGEPIAQFWGYKFVGIFNTQEEIDSNPSIPGQLPGTAQYEDFDDSGYIDGNDMQIIGDPHPAFTGGFSNTFSYKEWDLSVATSFSYDFDVYCKLREDILNLDGVFNSDVRVKDRWRSPDQPGSGNIGATFHISDQTSFERWTNSRYVDYGVWYWKIQNINLGYTFNKIGFANSIRLSASIQNAFILSNFRYGNPDGNYFGNDNQRKNFYYYDYPLSRSYVFGVNINF